MADDPLHGITLEMMLNELVEFYGWKQLGRMITIRCFNSDPSIKSSITFLRRTPWARKKVEQLYLRHIRTASPRRQPPPGRTYPLSFPISP